MWREHLGGVAGDDRDLLDPAEAVAKFREAVLALDRLARGRPTRQTAAGTCGAAFSGAPFARDQAVGRALHRMVYDPAAKAA